MRKVENGTDTDVIMTFDEAKHICKLAQERKVCMFLCFTAINGFLCKRMTASANIIRDRFDAKQTFATGTGGWIGCVWKEQIQ